MLTRTRPDRVPNDSSPGGDEAGVPAVQPGGMRWSTVFVLVPYMITVICSAILRPADIGLTLTSTAPVAVLCTGAAWSIILLLRTRPARRSARRPAQWPAVAQGAFAAAIVHVIVVGGLALVT